MQGRGINRLGRGLIDCTNVHVRSRSPVSISLFEDYQGSLKRQCSGKSRQNDSTGIGEENDSLPVSCSHRRFYIATETAGASLRNEKKAFDGRKTAKKRGRKALLYGTLPCMRGND